MSTARQCVRSNRRSKQEKDNAQQGLDTRGTEPEFYKYTEKNTAGTQGYAFCRCLKPVIDIRQPNQADAAE